MEDDVTNEDIQAILFPGKYAYAFPYTVPDYAYMHRELAKNGVTLTLLWEEYAPRFAAKAAFRIPILSLVRSTVAGHG